MMRRHASSSGACAAGGWVVVVVPGGGFVPGGACGVVDRGWSEPPEAPVRPGAPVAPGRPGTPVAAGPVTIEGTGTVMTAGRSVERRRRLGSRSRNATSTMMIAIARPTAMISAERPYRRARLATTGTGSVTLILATSCSFRSQVTQRVVTFLRQHRDLMSEGRDHDRHLLIIVRLRRHGRGSCRRQTLLTTIANLADHKRTETEDD